MNRYFFVLGRNPSLSIAEIISLLDKESVKHRLLSYSEEVAVIETETVVDLNLLISKLGGTVKLGEIVDQAMLDEDEKGFEKIFSAENLCEKYFPKKAGKIHFGISVYDGGEVREFANIIGKKLLKLNLIIKNNLKEKGVTSGFVRIKERNISSVSVSKNRLLRNGAEIVMIVLEKMVLTGKTVAVQEFGSFGYRDMARPNKDKKSGIMPPKLARIMINLGKTKSQDVLLDPFCGSGTIIQEGVILGIGKIIGADISERAVNDTKMNLEWMFDKFIPGNKRLLKGDYSLNIFPSDVLNISGKVGQNFVDVIATEPYLGPPLYRIPNITEIARIFSQLERLYIGAFQQFGKILKKEGKVIIIFPAFESSGKTHFFDVIPKIINMGFRKEEFFPKNISSKYKLDTTERGTILYKSRDQFLTREIVLFSKE